MIKRRVIFINLLILVVVIIAAALFSSAWKSFQQASNLEGIVDRAQQAGGSSSPARVEPMGQSGPFSEFVVISEKTLFAEDRRPDSVEEEVMEDPTEVAENPPKWAARPMLHGVSFLGGKGLGVMTVFEGNSKNGELRSVEVGDLVQGYWVDEIGETTMRLRWGSRNEIIDMADASNPPGAGQRGVGKVTVIQVGAAPSAMQTTTSTAASQKEDAGIEVSVVEAPSAQGGGAQREQNQAARPTR